MSKKVFLANFKFWLNQFLRFDDSFFSSPKPKFSLPLKNYDPIEMKNLLNLVGCSENRFPAFEFQKPVAAGGKNNRKPNDLIHEI